MRAAVWHRRFAELGCEFASAVATLGFPARALASLMLGESFALSLVHGRLQVRDVWRCASCRYHKENQQERRDGVHHPKTIPCKSHDSALEL